MRLSLSVAAAVLMLPGFAASQNLRLVGRSDLGGAGLNGNVAVVGTTAIVGAGITPAAGVHAHLYNPYPCPSVSVKVVDLSVPSRPEVVATIPVPAGVAAIDVAALRVRTPSFSGDLAAIALAQCNQTGSFVERGIAYYDVSAPSHPRFLGRYQADADSVHPPGVPPCGPPPAGSSARCASSQHSVFLVQRPDGRVLSLSTEPGASASRFPSGDLRIVDVTNPGKPVQMGSFPDRGRPISSRHGCRPFSAGHAAETSPDGRTALLAYYDEGLLVLDISEPAAPAERGQFRYPAGRSTEGNAAYTTWARVGDRTLALVSDEDWIAPTTTLRIDAPASVAGTRFACEAMFTLFDPENTAQIYRKPGGQLRGDIVYLGRGCPANPGTGPHAGSSSTDPYLADPAGKIALVDRTRQPIQPAAGAGAGCTVAERVKRAQAAGAIGVIVAQTIAATPEAFSPDGDPSGLTIPAVQIDKGDADALRSVLCPSVDGGKCVGSQRVSGALVDRPGEWGGLRVIDISDPAAPRQVGVYRTPRSRQFPPSDLGVYSAHRAVAGEGLAYVAWNSDGLRVLDLTGDAPREVGFFVPPDHPDPVGALPAKA
ncbi:MAG: hypothetical protein H0X52_04280, partial [Gemmatimonadetes bacterium]|nr:hypothetical protein [Gemmatimonadota bacterium]